ncbi:MAG: L-aspartate oxidase [Armatimonadetes bacterium]|nr:L-aspartate oxidase [Armatimonadota bacterium]
MDEWTNQLADEVVRVRYLVIGSGAGGLWTAIHLADTGATMVIAKDKVAESNTNYAQGGIAAAMCPSDSPSLHAADTISAGAGLCDEPAVEILTREGPERLKELLEMGARFERVGDQLLCRREAAHSVRRIVYAHGDATGAEVQRVLMERAFGHPNIRIVEHLQAVRLVAADAVLGADAVETISGRTMRIVADATIVAAGGYAAIYRYTTNPSLMTGDAAALALRIGAKLQDMEFVQFHPTALATTDSHAPLISEAVRGEGAILLNAKGERFMPRYHPMAELAPRDVVARAMAAEMAATGSDHCYLDLRPIPSDKLNHHFPHIMQMLRDHGLNPPDELTPVRPAAHYCMGGISTDTWGFTGSPRLYAVGECACTGVHGANRLASNSLLEALVFGFRLAQAAQDERPLSEAQCREAELLPPTPLPQLPPHTLAEVRGLMWDRVGIVREPSGLEDALAVLREMVERSIPAAAPWPDPGAAQAANAALVAWVVASAAAWRKESRGAHFRPDAASPKPEWRNHLQMSLGDGLELEFSTKPVAERSAAPQE